MWTSFVIAVNIFVCGVVGVPTRNDVVNNFQTAVHHQDLQSILMSIEERLRNLDNIYSMHLSRSLEDKLEQYQRKLEAIDTKIIRLESLVMLNLDKIAENISTRNFKEDISRTNLAKKVDNLYEGITHRINYVDRKSETNGNKMQGKLETILTRLERMDESFTTRNEEIEIELSDAIAAIDDLKTGCTIMEESIVNNTNENFEISLKEQMLLMKSFNDKSNKAIQTLYENTTRDFDRLDQKMGIELKAINATERFLKDLKLELKRELNEYAVKVADMNAENWKTGLYLQHKQDLLETLINSTKTEVQNGLRTLMILVGKIPNKENPPGTDKTQIDKLNEKIQANFEKVFSAQNLFMDSCYRLQMDESQIESKISDILEKLMETFDTKTAIEVKDIRNLEKLIKNHDSHVIRNLHQTGTNVLSIHEKMSKGHKQFETDLNQVTNHLNALFSLIQDTLADANGSLSSKNVNLLLNDLKEMEKKITSLYKQGDVLTNSVEEIKEIVEDLHRGNSKEIIDEYFKNITEVIAEMEAKMNSSHLYYFNQSKIGAINQEFKQELRQLLNVINDTTSETNLIRDKVMNQILRKLTNYEDSEVLRNYTPDAPNIINMKNNLDSEINEYDATTQLEPVSLKPFQSEEYEEYETNWQEP